MYVAVRGVIIGLEWETSPVKASTSYNYIQYHGELIIALMI